MAAEVMLLYVAVRVPTLSPFSRVLRMPRRLRLQAHILAVLALAPTRDLRAGWSDPIGTHRASLVAIAHDLLSEARQVEHRTGADGGVGHPYSAMLRGVARAVSRFLSSRESLRGQLPGALELAFARTVAVMAGVKSDETVRALAKSVRVFRADGSPDPELVGAPPPRIVRWGQRFLAQVEATQRLVSALIVVGLAAGATVLVLTRHLSLDALPSWMK